MSHINDEGKRRSIRNSPFPNVDSLEHEIDTLLTPIASATLPVDQMTNPSENSSPTNTNDLLSYDKSQEQQNITNGIDPSESLPLEPPQQFTSPIPLTVSTTDALQVDPSILHLQASIRAMARRITTIQEVTESRFDSVTFKCIYLLT